MTSENEEKVSISEEEVMPSESKEKVSISEKVKFWEEQDKINQSLIPRVIEMHEVLTNLSKQTSDNSGVLAAAEARLFDKLKSRLQEDRIPKKYLIINYIALSFSIIALMITLIQITS